MNGLENPGILDAIAHDPCSDKVLLAMYEARPWLDGQEQLFQLQEKLNAYVSFVLDGEMGEAYPALAGKSVEIQLRTVYEPSERALEFIGLAQEQLDLQGIGFEVVRIERTNAGCGEPGCGCA
jgi:uncharacterized protein DUF6572